MEDEEEVARKRKAELERIFSPWVEMWHETNEANRLIDEAALNAQAAALVAARTLEHEVALDALIEAYHLGWRRSAELHIPRNEYAAPPLGKREDSGEFPSIAPDPETPG